MAASAASAEYALAEVGVAPAGPRGAILSEQVSQNSFTSSPTARTLFAIDKKILLQCIDLIRFNVRFHEEANRRWWWRDWLYPAEKEGATALTFANSIVDINERARGLENTDLISKVDERNGYGDSGNEAVGNQIKLAGKISDATGDSYSLVATPAAKSQHFFYTRRLAKEGKLPSQIMHERLQKLDQLETKIKAVEP